LLALSAALLWQPIREPVRTKIALGMVDERPPERARRGPLHGRKESGSFLSAGSTWAEIVDRAREHFGRPTGFFLVDPAMSLDALYATVAEGRGSCSTYTEALMAMCIEAGRQCREWANVSPPGVEARGHSVVDVWLPDSHRWALLDVSLGFWARTPDGRPLAAPALERLLETGSDAVIVEPLRADVPDRRRIDWIYGHPASQLVELVANDPTRGRTHWARRLERLGKPIGQIVQWSLGMSPRYLVSAEGAPRLWAGLRMQRLRLVMAGACSIAAIVLLARGGRGRRGAAAEVALSRQSTSESRPAARHFVARDRS
jgi:hypothetical protein